MQSRASLNTVVDVVAETNNNVSGLTDANNPPPTRIVGIIDVVNGGEPLRHSSDWTPPPPKKKWIRHYLLGEVPFTCVLKRPSQMTRASLSFIPSYFAIIVYFYKISINLCLEFSKQIERMLIV